MRFDSRLPVTFLLSILLGACGHGGTPDYPKDWAAPAPSRWPLGCPDLTGAYDGVHAELEWLLGSNPDFERPLPFRHEHSVRIEQDSERIRLTLTLNERGLPAYREYALKYNMGVEGGPGGGSASGWGRTLELRKGRDFECSGGWLVGKHFAQSASKHGQHRKRLVLAKDRAGNLIAGATVNRDIHFNWGDSPAIRLGAADGTFWLRWTRRPKAADDAMQEYFGVEVHRYRWTIAGGQQVPTRVTSFMPSPICIVALPPSAFVAYSEQTLSKGDCARGETRLSFGGVMRRGMSAGSTTYVAWRPVDGTAADMQVITVSGAEGLPLMPDLDTGRRNR